MAIDPSTPTPSVPEPVGPPPPADVPPPDPLGVPAPGPDVVVPGTGEPPRMPPGAPPEIAAR